MKQLFFLANSAAFLFVASAQTCPSLSWSDEFDGNALDSSKWEPQIGNGCDQGPGLCGWGNNELQYYTDNENLQVDGGTLKITAKREDKGDNLYTSGRIRSLNRYEADFTQGHTRIDARVKVPPGHGLWSALWMMPTPVVPWPVGGEIDIMEYIGREPRNAHGYLHYGNAANDKSQLGGPLGLPEDVSDEFHVFSIEKKGMEMKWFVDGFEYQSYKPSDLLPKYSWPLEGSFHLLLNLAVGGNWPGVPDSSTPFPAVLEVDYVRAWDMSSASVGSITGKKLVNIQTDSETYCVEGHDVSYTSYSWTVPSDATFVDNGSCIDVTFGSMSGYVSVVAASDCSYDSSFSLPVEVQPFYKKEFAVVDISSGTTSIGVSTGKQTFLSVGGVPTLKYERDGEELYDNIIIERFLDDADSYVLGNRKWYMDIRSTTAAQCTRVFIQLEHSTVATSVNYPSGRHSRYIAYIDNSVNGYQRLEFDYYDSPDNSVATDAIDEIVVLFDGSNYRNDAYYVRNFDSALKGCTSDCEPLSTNMCRVYAKSEEGMCTDGVNNDREGYDGDGLTDCEDADCWDLDPQCRVTETGLCTDGIDNDKDGNVDCDDPDCHSDEACIPTSAPTQSPTSSPTRAPVQTNPPTSPPTRGPTDQPTWAPQTYSPTKTENIGPTKAPSTDSPTKAPTTDAPTNSPSKSPTTRAPTTSPSDQPISTPPTSSPTTLAPTVPPTSPPSISFAPTYENNAPECAAHPKCAAEELGGLCCPTTESVLLECCSNRPAVDPNLESAHCDDNIDNDNDGLVDCDDPDCSNSPLCRLDCPATGEAGTCEGLNGPCCPTIENVFLTCCEGIIGSSGYVKDFTFIGPVDLEERAAYYLSNGPYNTLVPAPDGSTPVVQYTRTGGVSFDLIYFDVDDSIPDASEYIPADTPGADPPRRFYIDVWNTGNTCTTVLLQLESLPLSTESEFPRGRHSRYLCRLQKSNEWERVMCSFFDRPDPLLSDSEITHVALFFDPGNSNNNREYFFRNFDSTVAGCRENCEPATIDTCAGNIDGENGQCNDGVDNDFDTLTDCSDPNCQLDSHCAELQITSLALISDRSVGGSSTNPFSSSGVRWFSKLATAVAMALGWFTM